MKTKTVLLSFTVLLSACNNLSGGTTTGNPLAEDTSASGSAAGALGGALSGSSANGSVQQQQTRMVSVPLSLRAQATSCPTFHTAAGAQCVASGGTLWLTFATCSYPGYSLLLDGYLAIKESAGSAACGTFPNPGASGTIYRQYVQGAGSTTPGLFSITSGGYTAYIDNQTANLGNFDNQPISTILNSGYGTKVVLDNTGARSQIVMANRVFSVGHFDHVITGTLNIAEVAGASTRTVNGAITVYHNGLKVVGTSTFTNVVHSDTCCLPISGKIKTTFSAGANVPPTGLGSLFINQSETLILNGCGVGTLTDYTGTTTNVALTRCY